MNGIITLHYSHKYCNDILHLYDANLERYDEIERFLKSHTLPEKGYDLTAVSMWFNDSNGRRIKTSQTFYLYTQDWNVVSKPFTRSTTKHEEGHTKNMERIIFLALAIPVFVCMYLFINWCNDAAKEREDKDYKAYLKTHLAEPYEAARSNAEAFDVVSTKGDTVTIPQWTDKGGDWKACRKQFLEDINGVTDQKKYKYSPRKLSAKITGDTLWLISSSFRELGNRIYIEEDFEQQFKDCKFKVVNAVEGRWGGAHYWEVYKAKNVEPEEVVRARFIKRAQEISKRNKQNKEQNE